MQELLDIKLTPKQERILTTLDNPENKDKSPYDIAKIAEVSPRYVYDCYKNPIFINALRLRSSSHFLNALLPISKRIIKDSLNGKYMQQALCMNIASMTPKEPLVNVLIANSTKSGLSEEEIDAKISAYFSNTTPQQVVDTTAKTSE